MKKQMPSKLTPSQIRYLIRLLPLAEGGFGVKSTRLAASLGVSKPSVHQMLGSLSDLGLVEQESFGLIHLTEGGRALAEVFTEGFEVLKKRLPEWGEEKEGEIALCSLLSALPIEGLEKLSES